MGAFRHGIVGAHYVNRKKPIPRPVAKPEPPPEDVVVVELGPDTTDEIEVDTADVQEEPETVEIVEVKPEPKKRLKDMTPKERRAFYQARAAKAKATREKNRAIAASQQAPGASPP